ncbi:MAG TPA: replication initiator [Micromonosporaceae bacterium]|nr:replication initiator [Micromonosporaceae bacterium]
MPASTLDTTPQAPVWGVASNAEPTPYPTSAVEQALARAAQPDYFSWLDHVRAAAGCTRPIRLAGDLLTIETATGRLLDARHTDQMPDAAIYKACGNRRATVCPACARTYQADAYQLLRAGMTGGKGVPETVTGHPAVFVTLTAPSFGAVHTRVVRRHTCTHRTRCDCRPEPCHARRDQPTCPHHQPAVCWTRHEPTDPRLGQPLCLDCYDHDHQAVWNLHSGQLWHHTKQTAERHLTHLARTRGIPFHRVTTPSGRTRYLPPVRISHGKVAEMQRRGVVHFHAVLRLDGIDPHDPDTIVAPPPGLTIHDLTTAVTHAAAVTAVHTPPHPDQPTGWPITWGDEGTGHHADIRPITLTGHGDNLTEQAVAGYLAKYATKSTETTGHTCTRLTPDTITTHADPDGEHIPRLIDACWRLGRPTHTPAPLADRPPQQPGTIPPRPRPIGYARLRRWAHMLGYGGHFLTKARRYSTTFTHLRHTRTHYRRHEHPEPTGAAPIDARIGKDTRTVSVLTYAGTGWHTTGDALLANTAAALARDRQQTAREELAHHTATTSVAAIPAAA